MILQNSTFINLYKSNYTKVFDETDTDNLIDLNRELVDRVGKLILNSLQPRTLRKKNHLETIREVNTPVQKKDIYSCDRKEGSVNRYDYLIEVGNAALCLDEITIPKEQNPIFALNTIQVWLSCNTDTQKIICRLNHTKGVGGHEFVVYTPERHEPFHVEGILRIQILNHKGECTLEAEDKLRIRKHRRIAYESSPYTCFLLDESHGVKTDDVIGIYNNDTCLKTASVVKVESGYILIEPDIVKDITHVLNISKQNHLMCLISESH